MESNKLGIIEDILHEKEKMIITKLQNYISRKDFEKYFDWFIYQFELIDASNNLERKRKNNLHPVRPRRGEIYLIEFGKNVGHELNDIHMGIIIQNSLKNSISSTVIVIPISSSKKICNTHILINNDDVIDGKLNKIPSKAKCEQMTCIDKARLIHKIGKVSEEFMLKINKKIFRVLDIN